MNPNEIHNTLPCDAGQLIPHQPPMLLVSRLINKTDDTVENSVSTVEAEIPLAGPFICDGHLLPEYYIEVMAQAIAASDGYPRVESGKPSTGLLTGIDDFVWTVNAEPGEQIRITIRKIFEFGAAFIFSGEIRSHSGLIAEGQLKIWKLEG